MPDKDDGTRRRFLKDVAALTAGGAVGAAAASGADFDPRRVFGNDTRARSLVPVVSVRAASPDDEDYGQYGGDSKNQKVFDSTMSPVGVDEVDEYFTGKEMNRPPVTSPEGLVAAPGTGAMYVVNLETGETNTLPATGETGFPVFHDGNIIYGDTEKTRKVNPDTGEVLDTISGTARETLKKYGDTAIRSESGGMAKIDLNSFNRDRLDGLNSSALGEALVIFDDGSKMALNQSQRVKTYDLDNQEEIANLNNVSVGKGLSVFDDGTIAGVSGSKLYIWDENLNQIDSVDQPGTSFSPPTPAKDENGTQLLYNVEDGWNGVVAAYEIDSGNLNQKWEKEVSGTAGETILYGDTILVSGSEGLIGINRETGEEIFSETFTAGGRVGMPYGEKIPVSSNEGYRIVDAETGTIGETQPELVHEWRNFPEEPVTQGEQVEVDHHLDERNGEPVENVTIEYVLDPEDTGTGENLGTPCIAQQRWRTEHRLELHTRSIRRGLQPERG